MNCHSEGEGLVLNVPAAVGAARESASSLRSGRGAIERRTYLGFGAAAVILALAYTCFTNHVWEDYFITFQHSRNLCLGHGLVFTPGERVHGFTSPLGVLLPAVSFAATGGGSYVPALWLFRVMSIAAYAGAGVVLLRTLDELGDQRRIVGVFLAILYLLNPTLLDFSINGMETGFMALFTAWGFYLAVTGGPKRWVAVGLSWGGLMWTRPDGFVYVGALGLASVAFPRASRGAVVISLLKSALVCALVYLPWFTWAWWYYGTPVPHTVIAKANIEFDFGSQVEIALERGIRWSYATARYIFLPIYFSDGEHWHWGIELAATLLGSFSGLYWLVPVRDRAGRMASLVFVLLCFYLATTPRPYPWYLPPAAMLGVFVVVRGVWVLAEVAGERQGWSRRVVVLVLSTVCAERAVFLCETAIEMRIQQEEIERNIRRQVGLWIKDHAKPGDRVYVEPLGYIGFFSEARMADWPGLVAPDVVRLRKQRKCDFAGIVPYLRPEWVVARPPEAFFLSRSKHFRDHYRLTVTFDATQRLGTYRWIPGKDSLMTDMKFLVFEKMAGPRGGP
jgi:hypothetical protein